LFVQFGTPKEQNTIKRSLERTAQKQNRMAEVARTGKKIKNTTSKLVSRKK